ncbi:MAG: replication protein [Dehalococcoidales bacterium]|nr:replication protein [Dehalococcoidales bacterium]
MEKNKNGNSFTGVPSELLAAVVKTNFSGYEGRIFWLIVRKTFGWQKATDRISFSQFQEETEMARPHIGRAIKRLETRQIIFTTSTGYNIEYGVQTDYSQWLKSLPNEVTKKVKMGSNFQGILLPSEVTTETVTHLGNDSLKEHVAKSLPQTRVSLPQTRGALPNEVTKSLPREVNTIERYNYTIESTIEDGGKISFSQYKENLRKRFSDLSFDEEFEKYQLYWEGRKQKKPKLALFNWMTKARRIMQKEKADNGRPRKNRGFNTKEREETTDEERRAGADGAQQLDLS